MTYAFDTPLPENIQREIAEVAALRRPKQAGYRRRLRALFTAADALGLRQPVELEIAIKLAFASHEWSKSRPIKTSWRGFSLGATVVTDDWLYDAYNTKPLEDTEAETHGTAKVRICAEQQALFFANEASDVNVQLIVLVGYHHDDGANHMPRPCVACLRYFTLLEHHRDITMVLINSETHEKQMHTVGEIIDEANLPHVECTCCIANTHPSAAPSTYPEIQ